jgi:mono/diheme cytochrome c family protein
VKALIRKRICLYRKRRKAQNHYAMKTITTLGIAVLAGVIGAVGFAYSGLYDASASSAHSGIIHWLLSTASHASIERRAGGVEVPELDDQALVLAGVNDYSAMCAGCHGAPGQEPAELGKGLNPAPPDLAESAQHMTTAELFWVTKNGVKMTGMPAWGVTHDDDAIWPVVAFIARLPELDADRYQALLASAKGAGHHASGHDDSHPQEGTEPATGLHDHDADSEDQPVPVTEVESHDDHHDHTH